MGASCPRWRRSPRRKPTLRAPPPPPPLLRLLLAQRVRQPPCLALATFRSCLSPGSRPSGAPLGTPSWEQRGPDCWCPSWRALPASLAVSGLAGRRSCTAPTAGTAPHSSRRLRSFASIRTRAPWKDSRRSSAKSGSPLAISSASARAQGRRRPRRGRVPGLLPRLPRSALRCSCSSWMRCGSWAELTRRLCNSAPPSSLLLRIMPCQAASARSGGTTSATGLLKATRRLPLRRSGRPS
mmetsp:Transcript_11081/g.42782  ORF Transcript_11081/g.42782 Transcript_11081/m.42782 type:complete len:239 (+) Transcript_11081:343-1059(+)